MRCVLWLLFLTSAITPVLAQNRGGQAIEIDLRDQMAYLIEDGQLVLATPVRSNPSYALCNRRSVMNALKRDTTIANRFPAPQSSPSIAAISGSGTRSTMILFFVTRSPYLCVPRCPLWSKAFDFLCPQCPP